MAIHYFHRTDGADLLVDRVGQDVSTPSELVGAARRLAADTIDSLPAYRDWGEWSVHVYDDYGAVEIVPFVARSARYGKRQAARRAA